MWQKVEPIRDPINGFDLYERLRTSEGNVFFSPTSI
jgi:hypothetical protein